MKAILLAVTLLVAAPAVGQTPADHASPDAFTVGMCTHFIQRKGLLPENLRLMRDAGVESIRDEVPWSVVQKKPGEFVIPERADEYVDAARAAGMSVMIPLDYGNGLFEKGKKPKAPESIAGFAEYATRVVLHFKGRVRQYEVWNEWNIGIGTATREAGTPEGYLALIEPTYVAIKAADPDAEVIGGVVAPAALGDGFFEKLIELGLTKHCDAVSVHTYNYAAGPKGRTPEAWLATVRRVVDLVRQGNGGVAKTVYVTEHGWPTHDGRGSTPPQRAADYLARAYLLSRTVPELGGVWWYDFQDDGWDAKDGENNFGVVRPDLTPKPAYFALADVAALLGGATYDGRLDAGGDETVYALKFKRADGRRTLAVWSTEGTRQLVLAPTGAAASATARLTQVGRTAVERAWLHEDWVGKPKAEVEARLAVLALPTPTLVEFGAEGDATVDRVAAPAGDAE